MEARRWRSRSCRSSRERRAPAVRVRTRANQLTDSRAEEIVRSRRWPSSFTLRACLLPMRSAGERVRAARLRRSTGRRPLAVR
jgi:hypothetical protein